MSTHSSDVTIEQITNGRSPDVEEPCGACGGTAHQEEETALAGWQGVNWDHGVEWTYVCEDCEREGKVTGLDDGSYYRNGCVAPPREPAAAPGVEAPGVR